MIDSVTDYTFVGLFIACFVMALLSNDPKARYGFLILFSSWVVYNGFYWAVGPKLKYIPATEYLSLADWNMLLEVAINIYVFVAFLYLSAKPVRNEFFSRWPNAILMIEIMIFISHVSFFAAGWEWHNRIINYLFALEILIVILVAFSRTWGRVKKLRQYLKSRGLFRVSEKRDN